MAHAEYYLIVRQTIDTGLHIIRWLGGNGVVGLAMMEAYFHGTPWLSARQIGARADCSEDTARRQADSLVSCKRAKARLFDGRKLYAIDGKVAGIVMDKLSAFDVAV